MKAFTRFAIAVCILLLAVGCAKTQVTERHPQLRAGDMIAKPERIYVYPFAATPADIPAWSVSAGRYSDPSQQQTPEELKVGRELGNLVAKELVTKIQLMGLSALEGNSQIVPRNKDLLIIGYFETIEEGSTLKRLGLGFGSGSAELQTTVEGYQTTPEGPRLLGTAKLDSAGGKTPGLVVPLAVLAATANPIGLVVMGTTKVAGEMTGRTKIEGAAKRTAEALGEQLKLKFQNQRWIE